MARNLVIINRSDNTFKGYSDNYSSVEPTLEYAIPYDPTKDPETSALATYYVPLLSANTVSALQTLQASNTVTTIETKVSREPLKLPVGTAKTAPINIGAFGFAKTTPLDGDMFKGATDSLMVQMGSNTRTVAFLEKAQTFTATQTFATITATSITSRQVATTLQTSATTTGAITWALGSGAKMNLTAALTGAVNITVSAPLAGSTSVLTGTQGTTAQTITLTMSGVSFRIAGATTMGVGSVVLPIGSTPLNTYFCVVLEWTTATECFITIN